MYGHVEQTTEHIYPMDNAWRAFVVTADSLGDDSTKRCSELLNTITHWAAVIDGPNQYGKWDGRLVDYLSDPNASEIHGLTYLLTCQTDNENVGRHVVSHVVESLTKIGRYDVLGSPEFRSKLDLYISHFGDDKRLVAWSAVKGWIWDVGTTSLADRTVLRDVTCDSEGWLSVYERTMDVFNRLADLQRTVNTPNHTRDERENCLKNLLSMSFFSDKDGVLRNPPRTMREYPTRLHYLRRMLLSLPSLDEQTTLYFMDVATGDISRAENGTLPAWLKVAVSRSLPAISHDNDPAVTRMYARADELIKHGWPSPPVVTHHKETYKQDNLGSSVRYAERVQRELLYKANHGLLKPNFAAEYPLWIFQNTLFTSLLRAAIDQNTHC